MAAELWFFHAGPSQVVVAALGVSFALFLAVGGLLAAGAPAVRGVFACMVKATDVSSGKIAGSAPNWWRWQDRLAFVIDGATLIPYPASPCPFAPAD